MSKWNGQYFADLGERVLTTGLYGLVTMLTADQTGAISGSPKQWWLIVGLPMALSTVKCLLMNLRGDEPSASVVNVTSNGESVAGGAVEGGAVDTRTIAIIAVVAVGIVILFLIL